MGGPLRLLVIEDAPADFLMLERHLRRQGLAAGLRRVASDGELDQALAEGPWDTVLSDYNVPGMDFAVTLGVLKARLPEVPVILVSGSVGEERAVELLKEGVTDFILKENLARLVPAIERSLREAAQLRAKRQMEQALLESEARFRSYVEHAPMAVVVLDPAGLCVEANPAAGQLVGRDAASLKTMSLLAAVVPEDREEAEAHFRRLVSEGYCEAECCLAQPDGQRVWASFRAVRLADDRFLAFGKDISKRKRDEERLRLAAAVLASTQEGVVITDLAGIIVAVNPAFTVITEYAEAEVLGHHVRLLRSGRHDRDFYTQMWCSIAETGGWHGELWNRRRGGEIYPEWLSISAVRDEAGRVTNYVGVFNDISARKHAQQLEHLAHHDALTDLPNRLLLLSRLNHSLDQVRRRGGRGAVLFLDLDGFKAVNDTLGHQAGDELLQQVALRLKERLREADTLARLGGDEFVVVLDDLPTATTAAGLARELIERLGQLFPIAGEREARIGVSVGICLFPQDGDDAEELIRKADVALYAAKAAGRGTWRFHCQLHVACAACSGLESCGS